MMRLAGSPARRDPAVTHDFEDGGNVTIEEFVPGPPGETFVQNKSNESSRERLVPDQAHDLPSF
jgi:hypothetical protein